jgi:hypothetical protein
MELDTVSPPPLILPPNRVYEEIGGEPLVAIAPAEVIPFRVYALVDRQIVLADYRNNAHAYSLLGILESDTQIAFTRNDIVFNPKWNFNSDLLYLGKRGRLVEVAPEEGFLLTVATVISHQKINVKFGTPMFYG